MNQPLGTLEGLYVHPIKSMSSVQLQKVHVSEKGLSNDRRWAVFNKENKMASGKNTSRFFNLPGMLDVKVSEATNDTFEIRLPGDKSTRICSGSVNQTLSRYFGLPLELRESTNVPFYDDSPIHLIATEDLRRLREIHGSDVSFIRFRPNMILKSSHSSNQLIEKGSFRIEEIKFETISKTKRCRMVTLEQGELPQDSKLLRSLVSDKKACFGIYVKAKASGAVRIGSPATLF